MNNVYSVFNKPIQFYQVHREKKIVSPFFRFLSFIRKLFTTENFDLKYFVLFLSTFSGLEATLFDDLML